MSVQQTIEESVGSRPVFRYAMGFHYDRYEPLCQWLHERFEKDCIMSLEISKTGLYHIHAYGETSMEVEKTERQKFQGNGKYAKYLNQKVKKRYWIKPAKKNRHRNIMYCMKRVIRDNFQDQVRELNPEVDPDLLTSWFDEAQEVDEEIHVGKTVTTFQDRLEEWYRNMPVSSRPTDIKSCIYGLLNDEVFRWSNKQPDYRLIAAAEHLLMSKMNPERQQAIQRKMCNINELIEKNYRAYM